MFEPGQMGASVIFAITLAVSIAGLTMTPAIIEKSLFRPYWFLRERQYLSPSLAVWCTPTSGTC